MRDFNEQRYELGTKINANQEGGALFRGRDLSLNRNVLLYQFANLSKEKALQSIRNVYGFNHPNFLHILDISQNEQGLLVALESRRGDILSQSASFAQFSFEQCLELTLQAGKLIQSALDEGIRDFSLSAENLWLGEDGQVMVVNYWTKAEPKHRGTVGLFHLLYQLLLKTTEIPDSAEETKQNLLRLQETRSLSDRDFDLINQLFRLAIIESSPSFSFTLLLSQLIDSRTKREERPPVEPDPAPNESTFKDLRQLAAPLNKMKKTFRRLLLAARERIKDGKFSMKKIRVNRSLFIIGSALVLIIAVPILIFASKGDRTHPLDHKETISTAADAPIEAEENDGDDNSTNDHLASEKSSSNREDPVESETNEPLSTSDEELDEEETREDEEEREDGMIVVPELIGLTLSEAEAESLRVGLKYTYYKQPSDAPEGIVFDQDVPPGSVVEKWSPITFYVSRGP